MGIHRLLLLALLLFGGLAPPAVGAPAARGLTSSSSAELDYRENGSELPMYGLFLPCLALFAFGVYRQVRRLGFEKRSDTSRRGSRSTMRGLVRLLRFGLLQRRRPGRRHSAWTHRFLSLGFVVLALGSLAILLDSHVVQASGLLLPRGLGYKAFQLFLDLAGVALIAGVALALFRRARVRPATTPTDRYVLLILGVLLVMGLSGFVMEGLRIRIEGSSEPWSFAGNWVAGIIGAGSPSQEGDLALYGILWWSHAAVAFGLIAAVPFTPLRHLLTSPLQILAATDRLSGKLATPFRLTELIATGRFDVKAGVDVFDDFSWRERLALSACAGSGGCEDVCPAHAAGTPLSPKQLMEQLEQKSKSGSKELLNGEPSEEAVWSCTLCGACTQSCPVLVDPMRFVVQLRRGLVGRNRLGKQRTELLSNLSRAGNPYGANGAARGELATTLGITTMAERPRIDVLYWMGCAATFDARVQATARATVNILKQGGIRCGVLGGEELCCGDPARRIGEEGMFQELVGKNLELFARHGVTKIVTHCAHCFNTLRNEYPEFGAKLEVQHHTELIHSLIEEGKIRPSRELAAPVTLHDSCYVGRFNDGFVHPRAILRAIPNASPTEMARSGRESSCCGAGGANYWYDVPREEKAGVARIREAERTGARTLVTECPFCLKMLEEAATRPGESEPMQVRDIAEIVEESLRGEGSAT